MDNANVRTIWINQQVYKNIFADESLKEISAILLVNGSTPPQDVLELSEIENIPIPGSTLSSSELAGQIYQLHTTE